MERSGWRGRRQMVDQSPPAPVRRRSASHGSAPACLLVVVRVANEATDVH